MPFSLSPIYSKSNPKSKQMSIGRKKFNMDPKKGIEYLIDHGLLKNTPEGKRRQRQRPSASITSGLTVI